MEKNRPGKRIEGKKLKSYLQQKIYGGHQLREYCVRSPKIRNKKRYGPGRGVRMRACMRACIWWGGDCAMLGYT